MTNPDEIHFDSIEGEDERDTALLRNMAGEAIGYITSFPWCPRVEQIRLGLGVGGVVAVFRVEFSDRIQGTGDKALWVIVGDLPSAYLVVNEGDLPINALSTYCDLMRDWANAVIAGGDRANVFPVDANPTRQNANDLQSRIEFLRREILPTNPRKA